MANYRGQDGSVTYATDPVAEMRSWALSGVTVETIDDTVKGDAVRTYKGGIADSGTLTCEIYLNYADTATAAWVASVLAGTGASVACEAIVTSTGPKKFTFGAIPSGLDIASPEGSALVTATLTAKITGAITPSWT